jgi:glutamate carboxypeptidase
MNSPANFKWIALTIAVLILSANGNSAPDPKWWNAAQSSQPQVIQTLQELVSIESGSKDLEGLAKMAAAIESRLKGLGMKTRREKTTSGPGGDIVIGSNEGKGKLRVMLQAHMDTVYPRETLQTQPYHRDGNRIYGPGIADDKGGIAIILHGLKILADAGWTDFASLTVLVNPDEEIGSPGSGQLITSLAAEHDVVLSFEPSESKEASDKDTVVLGTAGVTRIVMKVQGRAAHAGVAPESGRNALVELAHQIVDTRDIAESVPGGKLNWTVASNQNANNQIPELATATADVRSTQPGADEKILEALKARTQTNRLVPETQVSFEMQKGRPTFMANAKGRELGEMALAIYREMGRELVIKPMVGGGTDAAFANLSGKPAVIEGLGLPGWGYHARDEYIDINGISPRLYLLVRMLEQLGQNPALSVTHPRSWR